MQPARLSTTPRRVSEGHQAPVALPNDARLPDDRLPIVRLAATGPSASRFAAGTRFFSTKTAASLIISLLLAVTSVLFGSQPAAAQDYHTERFEAGKAAYASGSHQQAITEFQLACLGMLEEAALYGRCKTHLFLAQMAAGQRLEARNTLLLLARLEQQQGGYSRAALTDVTRTRFETTVLDSFAQESFGQTPRFAALLAEAQAAASASTITVSDETASLADLANEVENDPQDAAHQEALMTRLYRNEKVSNAQKAAERLQELDPDNQTAACVHAATKAARNHSLCAVLLPQIEECPAGERTPFYIETRLRCYSEASAWNPGRDYLSELSPADQALGRIKGLSRRILKRADPVPPTVAATVAVNTTPPGSPTTGPAVDGTEESTPSSGPSQGAEETLAANPGSMPANDSTDAPTTARSTAPAMVEPAVQELAELRQRIATAFSQRDGDLLEQYLSDANSLASRYPNRQQVRLIGGELAYLLSDWQAAVTHLEAAAELDDLGALSLFYLAVAYHELDRPTDAKDFLLESLNRDLVRTAIVDRYEKKILGQQP